MKAKREEMAVCTSCDGYGHDGMDEAGCYYACYRCGTSGWISKESAEQEAREAEDAQRAAGAAEAERRKLFGVPDGWRYYLDGESDEGIVMIPPPELTAARVWGPDAFDDIPF